MFLQLYFLGLSSHSASLLKNKSFEAIGQRNVPTQNWTCFSQSELLVFLQPYRAESEICYLCSAEPQHNSSIPFLCPCWCWTQPYRQQKRTHPSASRSRVFAYGTVNLMNEILPGPVSFDCQVFIVSGFLEINLRKDSLFSGVMLVPCPSLSDSQLYLRPLNPSNRVILSETDLG